MKNDRTVRLCIVEDQVRLLEESSRVLTAAEVYSAVFTGSLPDGRPLKEPASETCPGIRFRSITSAVALRVLAGPPEGFLFQPVIRHLGTLVTVSLATDHALLGNEWIPFEPESLEFASNWLNRFAPDGRGGPAEYLQIYRGLPERLQVVDEVTDQEAAEICGSAGLEPSLAASLYPYQLTGFRWLASHVSSGLGSVLADEMGLGKTIQVLALIQERRQLEAGPSLVVCPLTLVENWRREILKFAPQMRVYRHVGSRRARRAAAIRDVDVVLTSYETAVNDQAVLRQVAWDLLIADEAQAIKNPDTLRSKALRVLPRNAAVAVTGTPLENRSLDIWSLADFVIPGYLGSRERFSQVLEDDPARLRGAVRPLLLRREIADVAKDLPERIDIDVALEMFAPEAEAYEALRAETASKSGGLAGLTALRTFTAHPGMRDANRWLDLETSSAKFTRLFEILQEISTRGGKVLVFAAFRLVIDAIEERARTSLFLPASKIDGRTPSEDRLQRIDQFSQVSGPALLVLNPAAAGVGLNIQAANHVIHYTLEWNPAREDQATARAWRRGQTRPVTVHRLFYVNTVDEAILRLLEKKRALFGEVVQPTDDEELAELFAAAIRMSPTGQ